MAVSSLFTMTHFLSSNRHYLSTKDALDVHDALRTDPTTQVEDRVHLSFLTPSRLTSLPSASVLSRRSSGIRDASVSTFGYQPEVPHLTQTPWERERYKKNSPWRRLKPEYVFPEKIFKRLPREVYDCIAEQLTQIHNSQDQSCPCYLNDLFNLALTSRACDRAATSKLYRKIWVLTDDECTNIPKLKIKGTSRLKLLRRTLRERPLLGRYVRELHMDAFLTLYRNASIDREEILNLIASVVMACPKLERLVGFHASYTHSFDRLSHALSTKRNLKERVWLLSENADPDMDEVEDDPSNIYYQAECDPTERFLELNSNYPKLTTLVLHQEECRPAVSLNFRAVIGTLRQLPSLKHLSIAGLPSSFTNLALNSLPPVLMSLRLENLPGINDKGLQRFAMSHLSTCLESITLSNLSVSNLVTLSCFLSNDLANLKRFKFTQQNAPSLPVANDIPLFRSQTLEYIHWEIRSQACPPPTHSTSTPGFPFPTTEPISCLATLLLSTCVKNGLFPSLKKLRAPHDPQGLLQAQCKPLATALFLSDISARRPGPSYMSHHDGTSHFSYSPSPPESPLAIPKPRADSPMSAASDMPTTPTHTLQYLPTSVDSMIALSPSASRAAAQSRIIAARKTPLFTIRVTGPEGVIFFEKKIGGFMGKLESKITYELRPDRGRVVAEDDLEPDGSEHEWNVGVGDLAGKWITQEARVMCGKGHEVRGSGRARVGELF